MELLVVVLFVQVQSVRKHFFDVSDLDGHVGTEHAAVNLQSRGVDVVKRPNPEVFDEVVEVAASLKVR